ncbi:hypothetical protein Tco_1220305 [Tanacetum coccineum]
MKLRNVKHMWIQRARESSQIPGNPGQTTQSTQTWTKHGNCKINAFTTQKHYIITTTDKHGVPPTKRLFRVPTLDPSPEFIGPWGTSGDPGQPRMHFLLQPILTSNVNRHEYILVPLEDGKGPIKSMPLDSKNSQTVDRSLLHLITCCNYSLTLTNVNTTVTKSFGILVDVGPIEIPESRDLSDV